MMRFPKKITAFFLAFLLVFSPMASLPMATDGFAAGDPVLKTSVSPAEITADDTVTVTVSLESAVSVKGFGLDFSTAYDHTVFEWVRGGWSQSVKSKAILAGVNPGMQAVFLCEEEDEISGEIFSFVLKPVGLTSCEAKYEIKVLTNDKLVVQPVGATVSAKHSYDHACDTDCNACGKVRTITHDYTNDCDADCNVCGQTRPARHIYDNYADTQCNRCPFVRALPTYVYAVNRGEEVTVEVSLDKAVTTRGFGLDLLSAYDQTAFEWVSGGWSQQILNQAILQQTNPGSEAVFASNKDMTLSGVIFTFTLKVKQDAPFDDYDVAVSFRNAGEATPSVAGISVHECTASSKVEGDVEGHWNVCAAYACTKQLNKTQHGYDHACDTDCNACGQTRTITHDYSVQDKDETNHWMKCSVCAAIDESTRTAHVHDHACDTDCNVCGQTRTITHDYSVQDKDDTNHWMKCSVCGIVDESTRTAHVYDGVCDADCNVCGQVRTITHDYTVQDKDETNHWMKCSLCGTVDETSRKAHDHDNNCDADCNTCGQTRVPADHVYDDANDLTCNECGYERPPYIPGDVNNDKVVDLEDAIYFLFHVNFPEFYPVDQPTNFDGKGETDLEDAIYLLFHVNFPEFYPLFPKEA